MSNKKEKYTKEFKDIIIELYKSGKSLAELNAEYGISTSTISTWAKENSPVVSSCEDSMALKEFKALEKN
ncbi:transposase IS3/IS911 family protein [Gottschalkia acidurici 9a]|uniref:Transposase IS3/IS911 family protein n=1 Tax=Gottschalkia acidurici (strain ATCC 7906 / DSM 604 / BCRC 14475 / CIP 104303 / KCTC 5404 / NCIMB 10678 / 9a) TaxID=1128398 RepID=K0AUI0_GOTA9|nr:transposase [Gottschalkia acidurici]AFS77523.1 transposase IS3/IS911 family protein [Gottschalkia acidurici 9a]